MPLAVLAAAVLDAPRGSVKDGQGRGSIGEGYSCLLGARSIESCFIAAHSKDKANLLKPDESIF